MNKREQMLEKRLKQTQAQLDAIRAKKRAQERKDDTRRKILDGGIAQGELRNNPDGEYARTHCELREKRLTRDIDRALFGLDPLPSSEPRQDFERAKNTAKK